MKRLACYITILAIFFLGLSFQTQKTTFSASSSEADTMQVSSAALVLQGRSTASASLSNMKTDRNEASVLRGLFALFFLIFSATFLGLKFRSLSAIFSLCLLFISINLLHLRALHAQDGKKRVLLT